MDKRKRNFELKRKYFLEIVKYGVINLFCHPMRRWARA